MSDEDDGSPIPIVLSLVSALGEGCTYQQVLKHLEEDGLTCDEDEFNKAYRHRFPGGEVGDMNRNERKREVDKVVAQVGPNGAYEDAKKLCGELGVDLDIKQFRKARLAAGYPGLRPGVKTGMPTNRKTMPHAPPKKPSGVVDVLTARIAELEADIECLRRAKELLSGTSR